MLHVFETASCKAEGQSCKAAGQSRIHFVMTCITLHVCIHPHNAEMTGTCTLLSAPNVTLLEQDLLMYCVSAPLWLDTVGGAVRGSRPSRRGAACSSAWPAACWNACTASSTTLPSLPRCAWPSPGKPSWKLPVEPPICWPATSSKYVSSVCCPSCLSTLPAAPTPLLLVLGSGVRYSMWLLDA